MFISVEGARLNNLQNVSVKIPRNKITVIYGPSGSGKSSLAFHTLYNESKRRFINSFPSSVKFFGDRPAPVDVDRIFPVLPAFGLQQINPVIGARSTIADTMGLTELLSSFYAKFSEPYCPVHDSKLKYIDILEQLESQISYKAESEVFHISIQREDFVEHFQNEPFPNRTMPFDFSGFREFEKDDEYWEVFRFKAKQVSTSSLRSKFKPYLDKNLKLFITKSIDSLDTKPLIISKKLICDSCDHYAEERSHGKFNPYNALGACSDCGGFGAKLEYDESVLVNKDLSVEEGGVKLLEFKRYEGLYDSLYWELKKAKISTQKKIGTLPKKFWKIFYEGQGDYCGAQALFDYLETKKYKPSTRIFIRRLQKEVECETCNGSRINKDAMHFKLSPKTPFYFNYWKLSIGELYDLFQKIDYSGSKEGSDLFKKMHAKIVANLKLATEIGLNHLVLSRKTKSTSAGEYQRLLLLKYLSYDGTDSLFIFDEPSLGLSPTEISKIWNVLTLLKSQKNTIIIVDHNNNIINKADYVISMGPEGGAGGGKILYEGPPQKSKTLGILKNVKSCEKPTKRKFLEIKKSKFIERVYPSCKIPYNELTQITGRSGSGKSAVIVNTLANSIYKDIYGEKAVNIPGTYETLNLPEKFDDVIIVDSKLNRFTSRSSVGSYTELATIYRKHYSSLPTSKSMGLKDGHFSANSELGQCPNCEGKGIKIIEMQYLEDIKLICEDCKGKRLKPIYASITDGKFTAYESSHLPLSISMENMRLTPKFQRIMEYIRILKLDYLSLDRSLNTLSGGEKQRLFLLNKIIKKVQNSLIIIENISFGLSDSDMLMLRELFENLLAENNTIIVIDEHYIIEKLATYHLKFD